MAATTRPVRLPAELWKVFTRAGGADWLITTLINLDEKTLARLERDRTILKDRQEGMSDIEIARKHGLNRSSVWRARNDKRV